MPAIGYLRKPSKSDITCTASCKEMAEVKVMSNIASDGMVDFIVCSRLTPYSLYPSAPIVRPIPMTGDPKRDAQIVGQIPVGQVVIAVSHPGGQFTPRLVERGLLDDVPEALASLDPTLVHGHG